MDGRMTSASGESQVSSDPARHIKRQVITGAARHSPPRSHRGGLLIRRSARATSRDVPPRPRSWRRESGQPADAYRSRVLVSSSLQGGAGPAREGDRPTRVRGGELTTGTRPSASYRGERGSSGSPSGRGVSRTATQDQRRQARIAVSSGAAGQVPRRPRVPARSACWRQSQPSHR